MLTKRDFGERIQLRLAPVLSLCWPRAASALADDAFLYVRLQDAKRLLVPLHRHMERLQHSLCREVVRHDPLLDFDRLGRHAERLGVEPEVEDQLFGSSRDAAEVRVEADRVLIDDFDTLLLGGRRLPGVSLDRHWFHLQSRLNPLSSYDRLSCADQENWSSGRERASISKSTRSLGDRRVADH